MPNRNVRFEVEKCPIDETIRFYAYGDIIAMVDKISSERFYYGEYYNKIDSTIKNKFGFAKTKEMALHLITTLLASGGHKEAMDINIEDYCYE